MFHLESLQGLVLENIVKNKNIPIRRPANYSFYCATSFPRLPDSFSSEYRVILVLLDKTLSSEGQYEQWYNKKFPLEPVRGTEYVVGSLDPFHEYFLRVKPLIFICVSTWFVEPGSSFLTNFWRLFFFFE